MKATLLVSALVLGAFAAGMAANSMGPAQADVARLRAHFDAVDVELRAADIAGLTPLQRASRAQLIAWLREYRDAGSFPRNDRFAERVPIFRDSRGVPCAMAYLIERSGHGDFVDRVAALRNNAYIRELADDAALVAWLRDAGLSVAEAARIQPEYTFDPPPPDDSLRAGYRDQSLAAGTVAIGTMVWNGADGGVLGGVAGLVAGATSAALGLRELDSDSRGMQRAAAANVLVGLFALGFSASGLRGEAPASSTSQLMPVVLPSSGASAVGLSFTARF